ncbi:hypothetical protein FE783_12405 [Paenibacillus mesophilus]|uniref:hypothetical protein n=1 Tax=Paenibacillus mesophilus TaxID=2582849 RepID=UPI00110F4214|nr:hypothetical protein [Paenibacillus mesophilus]TMV50346.1 hypothetical protein FE783_12405 [Paenibacillus mesophilus]
MSRLPFLFIVTGIIGFVLFQAASLSSLSGWLGDGLRGPNGWFHVHLFVLGWATMLAMGAVYQLIHVILQSGIYSERLGYAHYTLFTVGLSGLLYGFIKGEMYWIAAFAVLTLGGILLFGWNMAVTLLRASKWNAITISAACAVLYLVLTGLSGMAMGLNFVTGLWVDVHENLFGAHIWLGTVGWFGLLITGFSYKMLPMFYLAHDYPTKPQSVVLLLWNAAVLVGALSFLSGDSVWFKWSAHLLLTAAVIIYNIHLLQIKKSRHKRNPGSGIRWSMYGSQAFACVMIIMLVYTFVYPDLMLHAKSILIAGWVYLSGWVSFTVLGYASKIVPFLWWTHKYGKQAGKPGTPMMADLLSESKVNAGLAAIAACSLLLLAGLIAGSQTLIEMAGTALSVLSIAYISLIGLVFTR